MQIHRLAVAAVAVAAMIGSTQTVRAQTSPVTGTWVFEQEVRTGPDSGPVRAEAVLAIEQQGDSLVAQWTLHIPGREPRPIRLTGKAEGAQVRLISGPQGGMLRGAGGDRSIESVSEYLLRVDGDSISGTINRTVLDGSAEIPSVTIAGRRKG